MLRRKRSKNAKKYFTSTEYFFLLSHILLWKEKRTDENVSPHAMTAGVHLRLYAFAPVDVAAATNMTSQWQRSRYFQVPSLTSTKVEYILAPRLLSSCSLC